MVAARNQKPHQKVWLEQALAQSKKGEILVGDSSHRSLVTDQVQAAKLLGLLGLGLLSPVLCSWIFCFLDLLPFHSSHGHTPITDCQIPPEQMQATGLALSKDWPWVE